MIQETVLTKLGSAADTINKRVKDGWRVAHMVACPNFDNAADSRALVVFEQNESGILGEVVEALRFYATVSGVDLANDEGQLARQRLKELGLENYPTC